MDTNKYTEFFLLELLAKSDKFLEAYCKQFKSQDVNARLFNADVSCSCRKDLIDFYNENKEKVNSFLSDFISNNESKINLKDFIARVESRYIGGTTHRIKCSDKDFSDFVNKINSQGLLYRSVCSYKDDDTIVFMFL